MHRRLLGMLASAVIVFAACTSGTPSSPPAEATATPPPPTPTPEIVDLTASKYAPTPGKTGGTIIMGDWQESTTWQPYYEGQVTDANVASAVWSSLTVSTNDYKFLPDLAKDIPTVSNGEAKVPGVSGDAMTVTWTLKDGEKWSDGQPLTCADFEFTRAWLMDPGNTGLYGGTGGWEDMTKIECPSPTTIVEHFKKVYEGYVGLGTPLPQHYLQGIPMADQVKGTGFKPSDMPKVPTSGAFKFQSVTPGQELRLARNDNYKGFKSGVPAYLDTLIFKWYGDPTAMIAGYVAGEVDIMTDLLAADTPTLDKQGLTSQIASIPSLTYEFLRPNWAAGPGDPTTGVGGCSRNPAVADRGKDSVSGTSCPASDPQFRLALAYAVNKDEINTRILGGLETVANTATAPDAYYYVAETAPSYDPAKAASILDAAGWTVGADGIRVKNGLRAKIELCTTTRQARIDTLNLLVQQFKAVGIEAIANAVNASANIFATYNSATKDTACALSHSNFDVAEHAFSVSVDPIGNYQTYHSSQFEPKGGNDAQVSDPALDKALETVKGTIDFVAVKHAMQVVQDLYVQKIVEIPLYFRKQVDVVSSKVGNFFSNPTSAGPTWNAVDWYLKG
jgi:peptide/nickel transport system substrate-binding protein